MIGKYCDSIPPSHVSSSNEVLIHFKSDETDHNNGGFQMEYNPTGNTVIQNNAEYYGDYYTGFREYSSFLDDFFFHIELLKLFIR